MYYALTLRKMQKETQRYCALNLAADFALSVFERQYRLICAGNLPKINIIKKNMSS